MRRLLIIPGLLFGLFFTAGGFFVLAETALPMWQSWTRMQDWRPAQARLLSLSGDGNATRAGYRYEFAGRDYRGNRVAVSEFSDNIGSYHRDLQAYLGRIRARGEPLPIWVNPANPAEAVIDRDMRWGLFALVAVFCSVFVLIGLVAVVASLRAPRGHVERRRPSLWELRKQWMQARAAGATDLEFLDYCRQLAGAADPAEQETGSITDWQSREGWEDARIASDARKGAWFFWGFAIFWNALSAPVLVSLPEELARDNYPALLALLFPAVGLFLVYKAAQRTLEYRRFGRVLFHMDPYPGAIGGHVGGHVRVKNLDYRKARAARELAVTLECVHSYVSGSGENRSRRESIEWAERGRPAIDRAIDGVSLGFRFDVPGHLPQSEVEQKGAYHFWRLRVSAEVPGIDLNRSFNIPVFATGQSSRAVSHDISAQAAAARQRDSEAAGMAIASGNFAIDGLARAMRMRREGSRIRLYFPMFRNKFLSLFAALFAGGFGFAGYSMLDSFGDGGFFGVFIGIFSIPFVLVALVAAVAAVYLPFNNLSVEIGPGEISVVRRLLFMPVFRRRLTRAEIARLGVKRSGSMGQGADKVEHFKIYAEDERGRKVTVAEDIDGDLVADHFRDFLAQRIGVAAR